MLPIQITVYSFFPTDPVTNPSRFSQATREHIQQSVLLSESAVHAGSLSWPPRASAADFLRLQFAAAAVEFVQSVENQVSQFRLGRKLRRE